MRLAIWRNRQLEAPDDGDTILLRHLHRENVGDRTILITAADKGIPAAHHEISAAAVADEIHDHLELILRKEGGLDTAENQALVLEQLFAFFGKAFSQHFFFVDALAIELVLGRTQQSHKPDIGIVLNGAAQEFELPPRLTFYVKDLRVIIFNFDQRVERV